MPEFETLDVPIRIGVISDTHLVNSVRGIPPRVTNPLQGCGIIFHAGDVNHAWVLDALSEIAPVHAVYGNNDTIDLRSSLPMERYYRAGCHRIGLIHGHPTLSSKRATARETVLERMKGVVDCIVYGHSHRPEIEHRGGLLMVNPGSPTQPRWAPAATLAIIDVDDTIEARLIVV